MDWARRLLAYVTGVIFFALFILTEQRGKGHGGPFRILSPATLRSPRVYRKPRSD